MIEGPVWLVGCGNMGGAMLTRWAAADAVDRGTTVVVDHGDVTVPDGVTHVPAVPIDGPPPRLIVLAVKPQQLDAVVPSLASQVRDDTVVVSILAGVDVASLQQRFPKATIVRAMPNLPVAIGQGVVALYAECVDHATRDVVGELMTPLGLVEWIDREDRFDAVTALSGCGPGFVFRFADALAAAGAAIGLDPEQARRLAIATVHGSATMAADADVPPATLADRVASPGGSTREGLNVLDRDDALVALITATLTASRDRNAELAEAGRVPSR